MMIVKCKMDVEIDRYNFHKDAFYFADENAQGQWVVGDDEDNVYANLGNNLNEYFKVIIDHVYTGLKTDMCPSCCENMDRCPFYE